MAKEDTDQYINYLQSEIAVFEASKDDRIHFLRTIAGGLQYSRVLDVGCGAGQELLRFVEMGATRCVGVDAQIAAGNIFRKFFADRGIENRVEFVNARSEHLPFSGACFDLVICRVALPYMNSHMALSEMERVLDNFGRLVLTVHTPSFYWRMIRQRLTTFSARKMAYPCICFLGGSWYWLTGKQPKGSFWKGKETFHTRGMLRRELDRLGLQVQMEFASGGKGSRSFVIVKK